jgi:hypothetical protein
MRVLERLEHRALRIEDLHRVLREVADADARAERDGPGVGRRLAGDELQERALARAVHAHDTPSLPPADEEVESVVDASGPPAFVDALELRDVLARPRRWREVELDHLAAARRLDAVDLLELLHARLYLRRMARARLEAGDERLFLREHRLLARVLRFGLLGQDGALAVVEVVVAGEGRELAAVDLDDARAEAVHELAVVRRHDERAVEVAEERLEPEDRLDVEVVRRLVEEERVGCMSRMRASAARISSRPTARRRRARSPRARSRARPGSPARAPRGRSRRARRSGAARRRSAR